MANIKLTVEYDGSEYFGFQKQPDVPTIQGRLEEALRQVVFLESPLYGAGRTDAGVHARGQVVNFKASTRVPVSRLPAALNARLPSDIVIKQSELVSETVSTPAMMPSSVNTAITSSIRPRSRPWAASTSITIRWPWMPRRCIGPARSSWGYTTFPHSAG